MNKKWTCYKNFAEKMQKKVIFFMDFLLGRVDCRAALARTREKK